MHYIHDMKQKPRARCSRALLALRSQKKKIITKQNKEMP